MKPKHQRLAFVVISMLCLCVSAMLILRAFRDNLVFFYSPSDIAALSEIPTKIIRVGGLVKDGSIQRHGNDMVFDVTDGKGILTVSYSGMVPNLFREGQGVVAEGTLDDAAHLHAKTILAKHDENYMPKEVADALKAQGRWQEGTGGKPVVGSNAATPSMPAQQSVVR